jgi:hypothetical protein
VSWFAHNTEARLLLKRPLDAHDYDWMAHLSQLRCLNEFEAENATPMPGPDIAMSHFLATTTQRRR